MCGVGKREGTQECSRQRTVSVKLSMALQKVKRCHNERLGRGRGPRSQPMLGFVNRVKGLGYPMTTGTAF